MAGGVNKVILIGNLGADPEVHTFDDGGTVVNFNVATSENWKDKKTGEKVEKTEWHRVKAFGKLAEICAAYLKKGSKVYVEGKNETRKYQKTIEGTEVDFYTTEINAREMRMLDSRGDNQGQGGDYAAAKSGDAKPAAAAPIAEIDDDIPF